MSNKILNYLRYSGFNITFKCNPFHWRVDAYITKSDRKVLIYYVNDTVVIEMLCLTFRIWIDDGYW
jgi:hypothetical protein